MKNKTKQFNVYANRTKVATVTRTSSKTSDTFKVDGFTATFPTLSKSLGFVQRLGNMP